MEITMFDVKRPAENENTYTMNAGVKPFGFLPFKIIMVLVVYVTTNLRVLNNYLHLLQVKHRW